MVGPDDDGHVVEVPARKGGNERLGENLAIDVRTVAPGILVLEDGGDGKSTETCGALVRTTGARCEGLPRRLGGGQRHRGEGIGPALYDGFGEEPSGPW